ncbi:hypothetical protein K491DRAFT_124858 [Lophiostoma macrostomum CBS 122681]|uniref:Uncharacterized protein n=1 Tax=Lophiostoma macrostomum CBS 122681 TaxID=1314788 RepID=A0A6A6SW53_9PLEO|nr:hypothetical protein K491DRAFT_124858 [Lophiostoma macrostomum CBS 122681]
MMAKHTVRNVDHSPELINRPKEIDSSLQATISMPTREYSGSGATLSNAINGDAPGAQRQEAEVRAGTPPGYDDQPSLKASESQPSPLPRQARSAEEIIGEVQVLNFGEGGVGGEVPAEDMILGGDEAISAPTAVEANSQRIGRYEVPMS